MFHVTTASFQLVSHRSTSVSATGAQQFQTLSDEPLICQRALTLAAIETLLVEAGILHGEILAPDDRLEADITLPGVKAAVAFHAEPLVFMHGKRTGRE